MRQAPDAVITSVAIAAGLRFSSAYTLLRLPVIPEMERVMRATTLRTLLLGGDPSGRPGETNSSWAVALHLDGIHGLIVGLTALYPDDDDAAAAVDTSAALVHST